MKDADVERLEEAIRLLIKSNREIIAACRIMATRVQELEAKQNG